MLFGDNSKPSPTAIQDISEIQDVVGTYAAKHPSSFHRGYKSIRAISSPTGGFMSTDIHGNISINFATDKHGFNAGESLVSAIREIKSGMQLTEHEEYSIEVLWHEILHNKSSNIVNLPPINTIYGFPRCVAESTNQLVARHSYNTFLEDIGGKAIHKQWVLENGYGYDYTVNNIRTILSKANISETVFVKEANEILMKTYEGIDVEIGNLLDRLYKGKKNITRVFGMIESEDFNYYLKILN